MVFFASLVNAPTPNDPEPLPKFLLVLLEQSINSAIVGGIAGLSALIAGDIQASWKAALIAFGITFLVELRKYRNS